MIHRRRVDIGVSTFVWYSPLTDSLLETVACRVASLGFDAIELPLENVGDWNPEVASRVLECRGLRSAVGAVMPPGRELVAADAGTIAETQRYLRSCIDMARLVGAAVVTGPVYASVGRTWQMTAAERRAAVVEIRENLRPVVEYASSMGVKIGVEPLNRYETSVINTADQAMELLDGLPAEGAGICLDAYHMNIEEKNIGTALYTAGDRLVHLQVSGNDRGAPGLDHINWREIGMALDDIRYRGVVSIESFTPENRTIARAASIWRPLAENQDALARTGLEFLRKWRSECISPDCEEE